MRRAIAILACVAALGSCTKSQERTTGVTTVIPEDERGKTKNIVIRPDVPNVLDKARLGTKLAADGTVAEEASEFMPGQPVVLSIWFKQSPPGLSSGVIWYGEKDSVIARDKRPMNGAKVTSFALPKALKPGKYRVEGYWGGNVVADKSFVVSNGKK